MDGYKVIFEHEVLFRDLDALRHVNNVAFLAFMEDARMEYWRALTRKHSLQGINFILAEVTCRYLSPAYLGETLMIGIRARNLGTKSFQFEYRIEEKASRRSIADGSSVQVMYDYKQKQSVYIEERIRDAISSLEQLTTAELTANQQAGTKTWDSQSD